jgi:hypothetical protein
MTNQHNGDRQTIEAAVVNAWDESTSASPEKWSPENRALGHCAVTACIVQDYLGGDIVNTTATLPDGSTDSHYYNVVDGKDVDLTRSQFPEGTDFTPGVEKKKDFDSTREYVLSYKPTEDRYELLKARVAMRLTQGIAQG